MLNQKIKELPEQPGCYLYKDKNANIIYVGKAKNLKKRVTSYFNRALDTKTMRLVEQIIDFDYILTNNEKEALLLEVNLIKEHSPKYNILLKDDKRYPYVKVTIKDKFPRILYANQIKSDKARYYGPFPSTLAAREIIEMLEGYYPLRKCNNTEKRACIYYHIGRCIGSCNHDVPKELYAKNIKAIDDFFKGKYGKIKTDIKQKINYYAEKLEFEKAAEYKRQLDYIEELTTNQIIEQNTDKNIDIIYFEKYNNDWYYYQLFVRHGRILNQDFDQIKDLEQFLISNYVINENDETPTELITNDQNIAKMFDNKINKTLIKVPQKGIKNELLMLANKNFVEKMQKIKAQNEKSINQLKKLSELLNLKTLKHIEFFDNSHISTTNYVSAKIVFTDGEKNPNLYRKYNLESKDEYSAMTEVLHRRYSKYDPNNEQVDLLIVDGGKGQVNIAEKVMMNYKLNIPIIGLVKNERHTTDHILYNGSKLEINDLELYQFLAKIQDEGHRYAVSFHRQKRTGEMKKSVFEQIKGIGPGKLQKIRQEYPTIEELYYADFDNLRALGLSESEVDELMITVQKLYEQ